ncbi:MAG: glycosyltransferase family 4 protein [Clostridia bacterium]|nr:glycosyltransferase family 4 protein [Clostridia bacterium]
MKVLITTDLYTTETNGVVTSIKNLKEALTARGHEVRVLTVSENRESYSKGDEEYYIKSLSLEWVYPNVRMPYSYRNDIIREIVEWKPDIIHSQCEIFSMRFAKIISRKTKAPIVHTYHTMYEDYVGYVIPFERLGKWVVKFLSNKLLNKVSIVVAPTRKVENVLKDYGLKQQMRVVPTGISLDKHKEPMDDSERLERRRALGIEDDEFVLISLGRLGNEKNTEELIKFFANVEKKHPRMRLLIVGDGPNRENLEKLAEELKLGDKVIFTGMVAPSEVQKYYKLGDLYVSASTSETQGLTYAEAAANRLPLLCREDPVLKDIIVSGHNGYEYTNEDEFERSLAFIMSNPEWRREAGVESEIIADIFDKSTFGESIEELYKSLVELGEGAYDETNSAKEGKLQRKN